MDSDNSVTVSAVKLSWEMGKVTTHKKLEKKQRKQEKNKTDKDKICETENEQTAEKIKTQSSSLVRLIIYKSLISINKEKRGKIEIKSRMKRGTLL